MVFLLEEKRTLWQQLAEEKRPVVLYGMGDGADKILDVCRRCQIPVQGIFASDGFVRGQQFRGMTVETLAQLEQRLGSVVVLLGFATHRPAVLQQIAQVAQRHPLFAPDVPLFGSRLVDGAFLRRYGALLQKAFGLMGDEQSRQVFRDVLDFKLSGKISYLQRCSTPRDEVFEQLIQLGDRELFVDCGAYNGDTVEEFLQHTQGRYEGILAVEPDQRNYRKLVATVERRQLHGVECHNVGVWHQRDVMHFRHTSGRQAALGASGGEATPVESVDGLLQGRGATLLKYDVEGAELQALVGSRHTIRQYAPQLMVSAYHRNEDLFRLPLLIHRLNPAYRIYLRHHPYIPAWETNIYAVPR